MNNTLLIKYISFFLGVIIFSLLINFIFLKFAKTLGIRNLDDTIIRWSKQVKPALGGISFYIVFLLSFVLHPFIFSYDATQIDFQLIGMIGAVSLGFLMGLADDAYNTKPLLKILTQSLCAFILIYSGSYINIFDNQIINYSLTVIWVVGMMNSINMLDNMDGITTSVSLIIMITIFVLMIYLNEFSTISMTIVVGMIGTLISFLYFNWYPSKMFMGDTGSQFLGVLLAALSINYLWNPNLNMEFSVAKQFLLAILTFSIPLIDTTTVSIKRIRKGKSPFIGGKDHTTHHLSYLGFSEKQVALIIIVLSIISSLIALISYIFIFDWNHSYTFLFSAYFVLVFLILFIVANKNTERTK